MGIFINLRVSKSVTKEEWQKVYEETLGLLKHFPLSETLKKDIQGISTLCAVPTREREIEWDGKRRVGWLSDGDSWIMQRAEDYFLPRDLVEDYEEDAPDAMVDAARYLFKSDIEVDRDPRFGHAYRLWGRKSQAETYHLYLLGIACLIEARLKEKAFVYGDITRGQCRMAIKYVNEHLDEPIGLPDSCFPEKFFKRVRSLPFSAYEQLVIIEHLYLGKQDIEFGACLREFFTEDECDAYWREKFSNDSHQYQRLIYRYLTLGFDLGKLCRLVAYQDSGEHPTYEAFVLSIMDSKLHLKEKNTKDPLTIDADEEGTYSIYTLLAGAVFGAARNRKVDRYIPIDEIRKALRNELSDYCDVDGIIDDYLAKEKEEEAIALEEISDDSEKFRKAVRQDAADVFTQTMDQAVLELAQKRETYDITEYPYLIFYESGDTIQPQMETSIGMNRKFLDQLLAEKGYKKLMAGAVQDRKEWLIKHNHHLLLRDTDWEKIFDNLERDPDSFGRYYPMMRVKLDDSSLIAMTRALMINDELYTYSAELAKKTTL